jgi:hypothetical protein
MLATPLQASVAVAVPVAAGNVEAPQATVTSTGQVITGGVVSTTVIVCTHEAVLPQESVAVQVRVMTELPAQVPACTTSLEVMLATPLQASVAVAVPVAAGNVEAPQATVTSTGQVITGGVESTTVMDAASCAIIAVGDPAHSSARFVTISEHTGGHWAVARISTVIEPG